MPLMTAKHNVVCVPKCSIQVLGCLDKYDSEDYCEDIFSSANEKWIPNRFNLKWRLGCLMAACKRSCAGKLREMPWHMKRWLTLGDRWAPEIDQRLGELLSQQTCQETGSSSWSHATGPSWELSTAKPPCLSGSGPCCPSYPSAAKILLVVCVHNDCVTLIGFVRGRVEQLRRCKPQICKERIHFSITHCSTSPFPIPLTLILLIVQCGLCIAWIAEMTLIVLVCCLHSPTCAQSCYINKLYSLHAKTCARAHIYIYRAQAYP